MLPFAHCLMQRQRRAEALEIFMLLKSVDLTSTRNLKRAVGGTSAELSISDVRHVAEHRQATIQQLKEKQGGNKQ